LLLPGDRFILRQFSPVVTIGGGIVVDAAPFWRRQSEALLVSLERLASGSPEQILLERTTRRGTSGLTLAEATEETGWLRPQVEAAAARLAGSRLLFQTGGTMIASSAFDGAKSAALSTVAAFHKANPLVPGISREELREKLDLRPEIFNGLLEALLSERKLQISGEQVHQAGRTVVLKDEEAESKQQIERAFATAGLKVPALKEVLAGLKVDRMRAQRIVTMLLRDKVLVKVSEDLVFHRDALELLRREMAAYKTKSPKIDVGKFKDLTGITRKYAIPLLEWLDRERVTRRVGDERVIL
jgi:selenocysteine-specific elongation factor